MKLTTFTDYTLRVLMYLAVERNRLATIPEIAAVYHISENHLMKVVHHLARAQVIESLRGKGGGIRLRQAPSKIGLGQVVRASEGNSAIVECLSDEPCGCKIMPACRLAPILVRAFESLYQTLDEYSLADLVDKPDQSNQLRLLLKQA